MVGISRPTWKPGLSASTRNIVAPWPSWTDASVRAMQMAKDAVFAPEMNFFSPSMTQPPSTLRAVVCSIDGSEPAPGGGSVIAKQDVVRPAASGAR
jgi:hypothetical protein